MSNTYIEVVTKSKAGYRRVFWFRESGNPPGVRCGLVGKEQVGGHTTYYVDGTAHIESKSGVLYEYDYIIPSNKNDKYYILISAGISPASFKPSELHSEKNKNADTVIEIDESYVSGYMNIEAYLVKEGGEQDVIDTLISDMTTRGNTVVYEYSLRLNHMSGYLLVVLVLRDSEID